MANCWQRLRQKGLIFCSLPIRTFGINKTWLPGRLALSYLETPPGGLYVCTLTGLRKL